MRFQEKALARRAACILAGQLLLLWVSLLLSGGQGLVEACARAVSIDLTGETREAEGFSLEVLSVAAPRRARRVFLYHTHTYEAYEMEAGDTYRETEKWRTSDAEHNIVRVGAELEKYLMAAGVSVTHDTTAYEPPRLSSAYSRSLEGLQAAAKEGYDLYIDLHRDSYSKGNGPNTVTAGGAEAARLLILIGQGTGTGFDERPDWQSNQRAAQAVSQALNGQTEGLCRGVSLKSGRYNQQAATPSMLIEVGNNKNTLSQALAAMPCLAQAICAYFDGLE